MNYKKKCQPDVSTDIHRTQLGTLDALLVYNGIVSCKPVVTESSHIYIESFNHCHSYEVYIPV